MEKIVIFCVIIYLTTMQVHCGDYDSLQFKYTKSVEFEDVDGQSETCLDQSSEANSEENDYSNYRCSCSVVKKEEKNFKLKIRPTEVLSWKDVDLQIASASLGKTNLEYKCKCAQSCNGGESISNEENQVLNEKQEIVEETFDFSYDDELFDDAEEICEVSKEQLDPKQKKYKDWLLKNGTKGFEWWKNPPTKVLLKVHIFNYTNVNEFLAGTDKKFKLQQLGPYVYREKSEKINITENAEESTLTYREKVSFEYMENKSNGDENEDKIVIPNVPMLTSSAIAKSASFFTQLAITSAMSMADANPFTEVSVNSFLWGYTDELIKSISTMMIFSDASKEPITKFGMLQSRNGPSEDNYTVHTGVKDLEQLFMLKKMNGKAKLTEWSTDECNRFDVPDGARFPPHMMEDEKDIEIFASILCRRFPFVFEEKVELFKGIMANRYKPAANAFGDSNKNSDNKCYCDARWNNCPPSGAHDVSKCFGGSPLLISYPHFYEGDQKLHNVVEGLEPNQELHESFLDVYPKLAMSVNGSLKLQINIQVKKPSYLRKMERLDNDIILPLIWFEIIPEGLSEELQSAINELK